MKNIILDNLHSIDLTKLFTKKNRYLFASLLLTSLVFYVTTKINTQQNLLHFIFLLSFAVVISMVLMYLFINESIIFTFFTFTTCTLNYWICTICILFPKFSTTYTFTGIFSIWGIKLYCIFSK